MAATTLARQAIDQLLQPEGLKAWLKRHEDYSLRVKANLLSERTSTNVPYSTLRRWELELSEDGD